MRSRWIRPFGYILVATLGLAVVVWTVNIALARGVEQVTDVAVDKSARVSYQGRLTNPSGNPLTGQYEMRFRVYPEETGGGVLWESVTINVTVDDGLFNVGLGIDQSVVNGQPLWLEVQIGNEVLSPRQPLQSAPYALGLFPGTEVEQNASGDGLTVRNVSTGAAVRGESPFGSGLEGYTEDSYAVYGHDGGTTQARRRLADMVATSTAKMASAYLV